MSKRVGRRTAVLQTPPSVLSFANIGGRMEGQGPLARYFDELCSDSFFGEKTWEKAESAMQKKVLQRALDQAGLKPKDLDYIFAGDLLNQCIASSFAVRGQDIPFFGLYGACSTMAESLTLAAMMLDGGFGEWCAAMASSHFCSAERQYRTPLEYGGQRTPTAQWTATAAGACLLRGPGQGGVQILSATFGRVQDYGVTDINNMGAAMMPAAASTLLRYFDATGAAPADFDAIFTGDLGQVGSDLLCEQMEKEGVPLPNHYDCGCLLYDVDSQNVQAGGSGAGCSAAVLCAWVLPRLFDGRFKRVLFLSTGALMSQTTFLQGETIPGIAHCVELGGLV